jgi:hypothetical protein
LPWKFFCPFCGASLEISLFLQGPVEARRGDLQRIGMLDQAAVLDLRAQAVVPRAAVVQREAAGLIEIKTQDPSAGFPLVFHVHQLHAGLGEHGLHHSRHVLRDSHDGPLRFPEKTKKWPELQPLST